MTTVSILATTLNLLLLFSVSGLERKSQKAVAAPILVPLTRESIPVIRKNQTVSYKTSYSGEISMGSPQQNFRVVFDTGSGNIVIPAADCLSDTCQEHRRYNISQSSTATAVNADGTTVPADELCDQVTIGYGTGSVLGEFAREKVCLNGPESCVEISVVMAVEMSTKPFKSFNFDGIFGLGLDSLAVTQQFSYFKQLARQSPGTTLQFGVFLTDGADGQQSEVAMGGYNAKRLLTPLKWAPVAKKKLGHWQVEIKAIRIGNRTLDLCKDGTCRGLVDTGTSHFGVPGSHMPFFTESLSAGGVDMSDCRHADAPTLELVLKGSITLALTPENYMRPLSLSAAGSSAAGSKSGVTLDPSLPPVPGTQGGQLVSQTAGTCTPRIMPVNLPAPMGPNLFILGEPVLRRYYTVYDWDKKQIGFGLSKSPQNELAISQQGPQSDGEDLDEQDVEVYSFLQVTWSVTIRKV